MCVCVWCIMCVCVCVWGCLVCLWLCLRRALLCFNAETAAQSVTVSAVNRLLTFFFIFSYLIHAHIHQHTHARTRAPTYASAGWGPVLLPTFCVYCLNLPIYSFTFRLCPLRLPLPLLHLPPFSSLSLRTLLVPSWALLEGPRIS